MNIRIILQKGNVVEVYISPEINSFDKDEYQVVDLDSSISTIALEPIYKEEIDFNNPHEFEEERLHRLKFK